MLYMSDFSLGVKVDRALGNGPEEQKCKSIY